MTKTDAPHLRTKTNIKLHENPGESPYAHKLIREITSRCQLDPSVADGLSPSCLAMIEAGEIDARDIRILLQSRHERRLREGRQLTSRARTALKTSSEREVERAARAAGFSRKQARTAISLAKKS